MQPAAFLPSLGRGAPDSRPRRVGEFRWSGRDPASVPLAAGSRILNARFARADPDNGHRYGQVPAQPLRSEAASSGAAAAQDQVGGNEANGAPCGLDTNSAARWAGRTGKGVSIRHIFVCQTRRSRVPGEHQSEMRRCRNGRRPRRSAPPRSDWGISRWPPTLSIPRPPPLRASRPRRDLSAPRSGPRSSRRRR